MQSINRKSVILITGAQGQVGSELQALADQYKMAIYAAGSKELDITNVDAVNHAIMEVKPAVVINAAAYTAVDKAETNRETAMRVNHLGPANLAKRCQQDAIPLLHISTDFVFSGHQTRPYKELDNPEPINVYGESKWLGEQQVRQYTRQHIILRTSWVFGAKGNNFVKTMLRLVNEGKPLRVIADQHGCPTGAVDIARTLLNISQRIIHAETIPWGTYHYCGQPATTWHGFTEAIVELAAAKSLIPEKVAVEPITTAQYPLPAQRPTYAVLNCDKISEAFGIEMPYWEQALVQMMRELTGN